VDPRGGRFAPAGFTLIELLVVITIIIIVSAIALPTIVSAWGHRQSSEAARILHAALVGARDEAIRTGAPSGIRLLPDPTLIQRLPNGRIDPAAVLAANRIVPIAPAPNYSEGGVSVFPAATYPAAIRTVNGASGVPCLVIEGTVVDSQGLPKSPVSWYWNIRVGDKIQVGNAGPWYTVVGPTAIGPAQGNPELFVNIGPAGAPLPTLQQGLPCEYLLVVNGRDDNGNGWVDEGFDGVDNDGVNGVDDAAEWEVERWLGALGSG
jgi:prepilin-type N-terminal cleavage/methylation domain-containing protein